MIYTVIDTETSGLNHMSDDILQFAYLTFDSNGDVIRGNAFYLWEDDYQWTEGAYRVHGLSREFLRDLPTEEMNKKYQEMYVVMSRANLIGYNSNNFDIPFVRSFMTRHSVQPQDPSSTIDVMEIAKRVFGKRMKLTALCERLGITPAHIEMMTRIFFNKENTSAHDATYDVTATFLCYDHFRRNGNV